MGNNKMSLESAKEWTQIILDCVLELHGSYYLPYLPLATEDQFKKAYTQWPQYLKLKEKYDPNQRLDNFFLSKYLSKRS